MQAIKKFITSSIGKKYLLAVSGLSLVLFVITHLAGNLTLLAPGSEPFNAYAEKLESFGALFEAAELGLFGMFAIHILFALAATFQNKTARPDRYVVSRSKGGPSRWNISSVNMIITGLVLLGFLVLHIWQFKYGPGIKEGYVATVHGEQVRDLHRLVVETFKNGCFVAIYVGAMILLGLHLRHGFWSAFQSLGLAYPRISKLIYCLGVCLAFLLALGFLALPIIIYLR